MKGARRVDNARELKSRRIGRGPFSREVCSEPLHIFMFVKNPKPPCASGCDQPKHCQVTFHIIEKVRLNDLFHPAVSVDSRSCSVFICTALHSLVLLACCLSVGGKQQSMSQSFFVWRASAPKDNERQSSVKNQSVPKIP